MKNKILIDGLLITFFVAIVLFTSCKDTGTELTDIPSSNVSYSEHIQPVFDRFCESSGCHNDQNRAGNLSLTSWANTTSSYLVVAPGLPASSKLVWHITGTSLPLMPPLGWPALNTNQINGIKTWVKEGAKNN
jgi:hypothetical protein